MSVTFQNIMDQFYATVGDSEAQQMFFTPATIKSFADESIKEAAHRTQFADHLDVQVSVAGSGTIVQTTQLSTSVWRVEYDGEKLQPITTKDVRNRDRFWESRQGTPRFYMVDEYRTDTEYPAIRLYETPSQDDMDISVYSHGPQTLITLSDYTQTINLPEWFAYCVVFGMLERAYEMDTEMQSFEKSQFYHFLWEDSLMRLRVRSYSRINKVRVVRGSGEKAKYDIRRRMPEHIPEP